MVSRLFPKFCGLLLAGTVLLASTRCGKQGSSKSPPPATNTATGTNSTLSKLPPEWSGEADYTKSAFEVIDE